MLLQPIISWKANVSRTFGDIIVPCDFYLLRANFVTREKTQTQQSYSSSFSPAPSSAHTLIKMFIPHFPFPLLLMLLL